MRSAFCNKCSELEGLTPCYDLNAWECDYIANGYRCRPSRVGVRLPGQVPARKYGFGDSETDLPRYAWLSRIRKASRIRRAQKLPNRWACSTCTVTSGNGATIGTAITLKASVSDPHGPATGTQRVLRGGAWDATAEKCRSAYRHKEFPVYSDACFGADSYGFRRARNADQKTTIAAAEKRAVPQAVPDSIRTERGSLASGSASGRQA